MAKLIKEMEYLRANWPKKEKTQRIVPKWPKGKMFKKVQQQLSQGIAVQVVPSWPRRTKRQLCQMVKREIVPNLQINFSKLTLEPINSSTITRFVCLYYDFSPTNSTTKVVLVHLQKVPPSPSNQFNITKKGSYVTILGEKEGREAEGSDQRVEKVRKRVEKQKGKRSEGREAEESDQWVRKKAEESDQKVEK